MSTILLKPVDTFFFRDHKPLSMGEDTSATGLFPPRPGTVYGALRSAYIHHKSDFVSFRHERDPEVKRWMGTPDQIGHFSQRAVFFHDGTEPILPLPLDYQVIKSREKETMVEQAYPLILRKKVHTTSDGDTWMLSASRDGKSSSSAQAYLRQSVWKQALLTPKDAPIIHRSMHWLTSEYKLGILRNRHTRTAEDGMLYQMDMLRFSNSLQPQHSPGLAVACDHAPDFRGVPFARLGGEARPWKLSILQENMLPLFTKDEETQLITQIQQSGIARIILLTPAIWRYGCKPGCWDQETNSLYLRKDLKVKWLTAVLGRPLVIGGWDIEKNRPKKRMNAVPAGSVLYVKVEANQAASFVKTVCRMKWTDELAHEGYGYAVCGAYHESGKEENNVYQS